MVDDIRRVVVIVLDSVGCGDAPDASAYGDFGANTLGNISRAVGGMVLPNLGRLGLGNLTEIVGTPPADRPPVRMVALPRSVPARTRPPGIGNWQGSCWRSPFPSIPPAFRAP